MKLLAAFAVVLLLIPTSFAQTKKTDTARALRQTELDFARAFSDRDANRFAAFVADDARFTSAGKITQGKAAIVGEWTKMMQNRDLTVTWYPDIAEVSRAGDLGYTSGPYEFALKRPDGTVARERGRFASVWRRLADGKYRIIFDTGSPEEPPPSKP